MTIHTIRFEPPKIITIVKQRTGQHVECYLEQVEVTEVYQHAIDSYTYFATATINGERYTLESHSTKFIDSADELEKLSWMFPNGTQYPKMLSISRIKYQLSKINE